MMPALASSSLYLPMAVSSSVLGFAPASESRLALTMIMNRMVVSLGNDVWCRYMVEWRGAISTSLSRSEEHTSELQSLMRISYAVLCLKKKKNTTKITRHIKNMKKNRINKDISSID